jgi:hypothetical protein
LLLAGGTKGKRFCLPHSRIMIHQPSGGFQGQASDIDIQAREVLKLREQLNRILAHHTGQPLEKIATDSDRDTVHIVALEGSPIGLPVLEFARDRGVDGWSGTATELLSEIERRVSESIRRRQEWPGTPQKIGNSLRRIAPNLRGAGVNVDFQPSGQRFIHISLMEHSAVQAVHDDSPSAGSQDAPGGCDVDGSQCPSRPEPCNPPPAPSTNSAGLDFLDGTDACSHNPSEDADDWTEEIL